MGAEWVRCRALPMLVSRKSAGGPRTCGWLVLLGGLGREARGCPLRFASSQNRRCVKVVTVQGWGCCVEEKCG